MPKFKSLYEENLLRFSQSLRVASSVSSKVIDKPEEDQELFTFYEEELSKAINNLDDKKLENEILKIDLKNADNIIKELKKSFVYQKKSNLTSKSNIRIAAPINICIIGETVGENVIINNLHKFFAKYGLKVTDWDIEFYNNVKLKKSDIISKLKKGQSKFNIIITGQIHQHSFKGNKVQNIFSELKKTKYIDHIIGCSPKELLTTDNILEKLEKYFSKQ